LGLELGLVLVDPIQAKRVTAPILELQQGGSRTTLRRMQKALNLVARYQVARGRQEFRHTYWNLEPETRYPVNPYDVELLRELLAAPPARTFCDLRGQAVVHALFWTRKRKGEIWRLRDEDLDVVRRTWLLRDPEKSDQAQLLLLNSYLLAPHAPFMRYRAARRARAGAAGPFWICDNGQPLSFGGFANLTHRLQQQGLDVNFHRWRHTGLTFLDDHDVPLQDIQVDANHSSPRTTMRYIHGNPHKRAHRQAQLVPGMEDHPMAQDPRELWKPLLRELGTGGSVTNDIQAHKEKRLRVV
ncbi:MAG: Phage integrase family, partial [Thermoplasmata archaeon]|nr:Phage integrase family [Thermoplasmata archaeon]